MAASDSCLFVGYIACLLFFPPQSLVWRAAAQALLLSWLLVILAVRAVRARRGNAKRTLVVLGSGNKLHWSSSPSVMPCWLPGGHTAEMLTLLSRISGDRYSPICFVAANTDRVSACSLLCRHSLSRRARNRHRTIASRMTYRSRRRRPAQCTRRLSGCEFSPIPSCRAPRSRSSIGRIHSCYMPQAGRDEIAFSFNVIPASAPIRIRC
jgi:hypothetical protein